MKSPIIAIGLESAPVPLLEQWMDEGRLPNLRRLRDGGAYARLQNVEYHATESEWTTFQTGRLPQSNGYWRPHKFNPRNYRVDAVAAYDFVENQPFWALGPDYRVAAFDIPQSTLSPLVNGLQVLAWGAHDPQVKSCSNPPDLLGDIKAMYGDHPAFLNAFGDNWWDADYLRDLEHKLKVGVSRRAAICRDLLERDDWDLFVTIFGETHGAGHNFWHLSQSDHPLSRQPRPEGVEHDPLQNVFVAIDAAIGEILKGAPDDAAVVIFNAMGMSANHNELFGMVMLPEILFRLSFPGEEAFAFAPPGSDPESLLEPAGNEKWASSIWALTHDARKLGPSAVQRVPQRFRKLAEKVLRKLERKGFPNQTKLVSPHRLAADGDPYVSIPASWYRELWPQMKAFALPSYSDGMIRINLAGRERNGVVGASEYKAACDELVRELHTMTNARTGRPIVDHVVRTRRSGFEDDPGLPDADLVVIWRETPTDVVESDAVGRIGPMPYRRSGGHDPHGCMIVSGPAVETGYALREGRAVDIAPTILDLMGVAAPECFDGRTMIERIVRRAAQ